MIPRAFWSKLVLVSHNHLLVTPITEKENLTAREMKTYGGNFTHWVVYFLMNRDAAWETLWAENLKLLLWYFHKGNWPLANDETMMVMISPLKSSFPQGRLQEIAGRCHGVFINLDSAVGPPGLTLNPFRTEQLHHFVWTTVFIYTPAKIPEHSVGFWRTQVLLIGTHLTPPYLWPLLGICQPHRLFVPHTCEIGPRLSCLDVAMEGNAFPWRVMGLALSF